MSVCSPLLLLLAGLVALTAAESPPFRPPPPPPKPPLPGPGGPGGETPGCSVGTWTYDGCNVCRCTEDRKIKCTNNVCRDTPPASCQYGRTYVDQCENLCFCSTNGQYICKPRGTPGGDLCYGSAEVGKPEKCAEEGDIRVESNTHFYCKGGIVHYEFVEDADRCREGASWPSECNTCHCAGPSQIAACTLIGCISNSPPPPRLPRPPPLSFGDTVVPDRERCPAGLRALPGQLGVKICSAERCTPGAEWNLSSCEKCVCTKDGEPACTPCVRKSSNSTVLCEDGRPISGLSRYQLCPADCGSRYIPEKDCLKCVCGVGEEGDVVVAAHEPCPEGFEHRARGAFTRACGPVDQLPKGDYEDCDGGECPADCIFVRRSRSGCVYCQCEGNELVPADQQCPAAKIDGPVRGNDKVCKPATREECSQPGEAYNLECDICICQDNGAPACTRRDCNQPRFGDIHVCRGRYSECPADCGVSGEDSYCLHCQCGPRLQPGDVVIPIEEECPIGYQVSDNQWATKTCSPAPQPEPEPPICPHGPAIVDECLTVCHCVGPGSGYACGRRGCPPGSTSGKPLSCPRSPRQLPRYDGLRIFCHNGIVKAQPLAEPCIPGSSFMDEGYCNVCRCLGRGAACTYRACPLTSRPDKIPLNTADPY